MFYGELIDFKRIQPLTALVSTKSNGFKLHLSKRGITFSTIDSVKGLRIIYKIPDSCFTKLKVDSHIDIIVSRTFISDVLSCIIQLYSKTTLQEDLSVSVPIGIHKSDSCERYYISVTIGDIVRQEFVRVEYTTYINDLTVCSIQHHNWFPIDSTNILNKVNDNLLRHVNFNLFQEAFTMNFFYLGKNGYNIESEMYVKPLTPENFLNDIPVNVRITPYQVTTISKEVFALLRKILLNDQELLVGFTLDDQNTIIIRTYDNVNISITSMS